MPFIRRVHLTAPFTGSEHITHVQHSATRGGPLELATRAAVVADIERGTVFYSHDEFDRDEALVIVRTSAEQRKYLSTVADRRETNNLLSLERF